MVDESWGAKFLCGQNSGIDGQRVEREIDGGAIVGGFDVVVR
jgi:hypothetical protein